MKILIGSINSRLETAEEKLNDLEDTLVETNKTKVQRKKLRKK